MHASHSTRLINSNLNAHGLTSHTRAFWWSLETTLQPLSERQRKDRHIQVKRRSMWSEWAVVSRTYSSVVSDIWELRSKWQETKSEVFIEWEFCTAYFCFWVDLWSIMLLDCQTWRSVWHNLCGAGVLLTLIGNIVRQWRKTGSISKTETDLADSILKPFNMARLSWLTHLQPVGVGQHFSRLYWGEVWPGSTSVTLWWSWRKSNKLKVLGPW